MNDIQEINGRIFRGRKLIINWGKLKVEISKLPYLNNVKSAIFDLAGSDVVLANVYENENGLMEDEILGPPAGMNGDGTCIEGRRIEDYFTGNEFWITPHEVKTEK